MSRRILALGWGIACLALAGPAAGQALVVLGASDNLAVDQPRVAVEVLDPSTGASLGPELFNTFLLDTGSNGILATGLAVDELVSAGYRTEGTYIETGVAGPVVYDVSAVYNFDLAGTAGIRQSLTSVRLLSSESTDLGGFDGVVGMPGMVHRVTSMDLAAMIDPNEWFGVTYMGVGFSQAVPASPGHRYTVPLKLVEYSAGDDPVRPTYAPLPFAQVSLHNQGYSVRGSFVVDTGAQVSIISSATAIALGLDSDHDGSLDDETDTFLPIGGVGGSIEAPVLPLQRLGVRTADGTELVWTDLDVLVLDIDDSVPGVLGMDLLTTGWTEPILARLLGQGDPNAVGCFNQVHMDFLDADTLSGSMLLDLDPNRDVRVLSGDADGDGDVDYFDRQRVLSHLGSPAAADWSDGDFDHDGRVTFADYQILESNFATALGVYRPCGDCDGDGDVDFADYQILETYFGLSAGATFDMGDFDHDGDVDELDYLALVSNYAGSSALPPPGPLPEPAALVLLAAGAVILLARARRRPGRFSSQ
jgi:hypothetical protein